VVAAAATVGVVRAQSPAPHWTGAPARTPGSSAVETVRPTCGEAFLPTDLDLITTVERDDVKTVHLHGQYRIGHDDYVARLGGLTRNLTLRYSKPTEFRLSIFPGDALTMSLKLYKVSSTNGDSLVTKSGHGGERIERMIFAALEADVRYNVVIVYSLGFNAQRRCPKVTMELATQPTDIAPHFTDACDGASDELVVPSIRPSEDASPSWYYEFNSQPKFVSVGKGAAGDSVDTAASFSVISKYPVTVPHIPGHHGKWKFRTVVHANFIDGGDIAAVLTFGNDTRTPPTPETCSADRSIQCYYGMRTTQNVFVLQEALWSGVGATPGQYVLWLVRRKAERHLERTCAPIQLTVQLHPLKEQETFINCEVDPMPPTFNAPGMYSNRTGVLRFNADVLVNLTTRIQYTKIVPTKSKSLMRAWVANHNSLDIDLILYRGDRMVASSMKYSGPEGIIAELDGGVEYRLGVLILSGFRKYTATDHDFFEFCDSFELQAHVFPLLDANEDDNSCSTARPPQLEVESTVNRTGGIEFGMYDMGIPPFTFPIDTDAAAYPPQKILPHGVKFYLNRTTFFFALVSGDSYGGTPHMTLRMLGSREIMYSKTRTVGQEIYAELEAGWYQLDVITPYSQRGKKWGEISAQIPRCIRYNFKLRINPDSACLNPLKLPTSLTESKHGHHHLFDEYRVSMSGTHLITLKQSAGSTLHVKSTWSDAPVSFKLYEGTAENMRDDAVVASSHHLSTWSSHPEIFANLKPNQYYTLSLDFDLTAGAPGRCLTFLMQLSLIETPPALDRECTPVEGTIGLGTLAPPLDLSSTDVYRPSVTASRRHDILITFTLNTTAHFRLIADHDFTMHAMAVGLCPCKVPSECLSACIGSGMYFNGNEVARTTLAAGDYSIVLKPWRFSLGEAGRDVEAECALLGIHLVIGAIVQRPAPDLCPRSMQYLPRSLNKVGLLSAHYGNEAHFFMHVKVSKKHYADEATFSVGSHTIVRVFSPTTGIHGSLSIMTADRQQVVSLVSLGNALYVDLAPGAYILSVTFNLMWSEIDPSACTYVPLEVAFVRSSHLSALAEAPPGGSVDTCQSSHALPTTMMSHGHATMYRPVSKGIRFLHVINFTVTGSAAAEVDADIRSNFVAGGLAAVIVGNVALPGEATQRITYLFKHYSDRAILNRRLDAGQYQLKVYDSVSWYKQRTDTVACTPFSFHLRLNGGGAPPPPPATETGTNGAPPVTVPATTLPSVRPTLPCPYNTHDILPERLDRPADSASRWFSVGGRRYAIPFTGADDASDETLPGHSLRRATVTTSIVVFTGDFVRVWVHSDAIVQGVKVRLFNPDAPHAAVYHARVFGDRTRSLGVQPQVIGDSTTYTLEVTFLYRHAPQYHVDYENCFQKAKLTNYELYLAVSPASHVHSRATCPADDQPEDASSDDVAPAAPTSSNGFTGTYPLSGSSLTLTQPLRIDAKQCFFTRHDCKMQMPHAWDPNRAPSALFVQTMCVWNTSITVPVGSTGVFLAFEAKYNLLLSSMRSMLLFSNGSVYKAHHGGPTTERDDEYNGWTAVHGWGVPPGTYTLVLAQAFTESRHALSNLAEVCVPFQTDLNFGGSKLGDNTDTHEDGPGIVHIGPSSTNTLDPSGPITLTLQTDTPMDIEFKPRGQWPVYLVDNATHARVTPNGRVYTSRNMVHVTYYSGALKWNWPYHVRVDTAAIRPARGSATFHNDAATPYYTTAPCSCFDGVCALGGQCACREANARCDRCPDGASLSQHHVRLGPQQFAHRWVRTCQTETATDTPAPAVHHNTPTPPHHNGGPTPSPDDGWPTPAPGDQPPATNAPPGPSPPDGKAPAAGANGARPPLKWMRVLLSAVCLTAIAVFSLSRLRAYAVRRQRRGTFSNPFRRVSQTADDEDINPDDAFNVDDTPAPAARSPPRSAAAAPASRRGFAHGAVDDDDDADENDAIV